MYFTRHITHWLSLVEDYSTKLFFLRSYDLSKLVFKDTSLVRFSRQISRELRVKLARCCWVTFVLHFWLFHLKSYNLVKSRTFSKVSCLWTCCNGGRTRRALNSAFVTFFENCLIFERDWTTETIIIARVLAELLFALLPNAKST